MSHILWLEAYNLDEFGDVQYTEDWINENISGTIQIIEPDGKLVLGYGSAMHFIYKGMEHAGAEVITSDEGDIFGPPKLLKQVIAHEWETWHKNDPRWNWRWETIEDFFARYGEYGYLIIVTVY